MFVSPLIIFFGEMSVGSFSHILIGLFVFLVLSCMSGLYILKINPLSVVSFAIIFSHSEGCFYTLLIVSVAVQKPLSLPMQETQVDPGVGKIPWRRAWPPSPVSLPGESQGWGSLVGCHLWGRTESDMTEAT